MIPRCDTCGAPASVEIETRGRVDYACDAHEMGMRMVALRGRVRAFLLSVERAAYHARALRTLSTKQRVYVKAIAAAGLVRLMPARGRFPRRYVLTAGGSHALDTFAFDTLHHEARRRAA